MENKKENLPVVAAFDFDGTLTYRDALPPFLFFCDGFFKGIFKLALSLPFFINFFLGLSSRQEVKENILKRFFGGIPANHLNQLGQQFAKENLNTLLRPDGLAKIKWHLDQGHRCVLISANLDVFLVPWGRLNGFQDVICSKIEVTEGGFVTGNLMGLNCWGPEKVRRLVEVLGSKENYTLYAYGDSRGDKELLDYADYGFKF